MRLRVSNLAILGVFLLLTTVGIISALSFSKIVRSDSGNWIPPICNDPYITWDLIQSRTMPDNSIFQEYGSSIAQNSTHIFVLESGNPVENIMVFNKINLSDYYQIPLTGHSFVSFGSMFIFNGTDFFLEVTGVDAFQGIKRFNLSGAFIEEVYETSQFPSTGLDSKGGSYNGSDYFIYSGNDSVSNVDYIIHFNNGWNRQENITLNLSNMPENYLGFKGLTFNNTHFFTLSYPEWDETFFYIHSIFFNQSSNSGYLENYSIPIGPDQGFGDINQFVKSDIVCNGELNHGSFTECWIVSGYRLYDVKAIQHCGPE